MRARYRSPRRDQGDVRSCKSRTTRPVRALLFDACARGIVAKAWAAPARSRRPSASSTRSGGSSEAAAKPPTVPISVIAPACSRSGTPPRCGAPLPAAAPDRSTMPRRWPPPRTRPRRPSAPIACAYDMATKAAMSAASTTAVCLRRSPAARRKPSEIAPATGGTNTQAAATAVASAARDAGVGLR